MRLLFNRLLKNQGPAACSFRQPAFLGGLLILAEDKSRAAVCILARGNAFPFVSRKIKKRVVAYPYTIRSLPSSSPTFEPCSRYATDIRPLCDRYATAMRPLCDPFNRQPIIKCQSLPATACGNQRKTGG